jgi:hypothetical protein
VTPAAVGRSSDRRRRRYSGESGSGNVSSVDAAQKSLNDPFQRWTRERESINDRGLSMWSLVSSRLWRRIAFVSWTSVEGVSS